MLHQKRLPLAMDKQGNTCPCKTSQQALGGEAL